MPYASPWCAVCLLLASASCAGRAPNPNDVVELWSGDRAAALEALAALPSERERAMVVEVLVLAHGHTLLDDGGCGLFPDGAPRRRCEQLLSRAHLYPERGSEEPDVSALNGRDPAGCGGERTPTECALSSAFELVVSGQPDPWGPCGELAHPKLASECGFLVAEELIRARGFDGYEPAIAACGSSSLYLEPCQDHLSSELARAWVGSLEGCPGAAEGVDPWGSARHQADVIRERWAPSDLDRGAELAQIFLAVAARSVLVAADAQERRAALERQQAEPVGTAGTILATRWDLGSLTLDTAPSGEEPTGPSGGSEASAGRLSELARALSALDADLLVLRGVESEPALLALRDATACLGGPVYEHHRFEADADSLLARRPLASKGAGLAGSWVPLPASVQEWRQPFLLDRSGQPMAYNPASKRGFSSELPVAYSLVASR